MVFLWQLVEEYLAPFDRLRVPVGYFLKRYE